MFKSWIKAINMSINCLRPGQVLPSIAWITSQRCLSHTAADHYTGWTSAPSVLPSALPVHGSACRGHLNAALPATAAPGTLAADTHTTRQMDCVMHMKTDSFTDCHCFIFTSHFSFGWEIQKSSNVSLCEHTHRQQKNLCPWCHHFASPGTELN